MDNLGCKTQIITDELIEKPRQEEGNISYE